MNLLNVFQWIESELLIRTYLECQSIAPPLVLACKVSKMLQLCNTEQKLFTDVDGEEKS